MRRSENTRPLRIVHLSDTHLFGDATLHYNRVDTRAALERTLAAADRITDLDLVVASGDLSDDGSIESYREVAQQIGSFAAAHGAAAVYAMGNHDVRAGFESILGVRETTLMRRGYRVITLDSTVPGAGYGQLSSEQLSDLQRELSTPAPQGTIVVLHHPPIPASSTLLQSLELHDPSRLLDVCAETDVRVILAGHYHHALVSIGDHTPVVVAPGIANHSDPWAVLGTERAVIGSGFGVIDVDPEGNLRTTFTEVPGPDDGAELFSLASDEVAHIAATAGSPS